MKSLRLRRMLAGACLLVWPWLAGHAQTLLGEFALRGSLANNVASGPSLGLVPFSSVTGSITANGYVFDRNQGVTFTSASLSTTDYTIELSFKTNLDSPSAWSKLVDLSGAGNNDSGLYIYNNSGYRLQFYPQTEAVTADFSAGPDFNVVLTRDGTTSLVTGYVNGVARFSFTDSSSQAVITAASNTLTFFVDDTDTARDEVSGGTLNYLRIYNGALSAGQVSALYAAGAPSAVPEPATTAVVAALGALALAVARRRRGWAFSRDAGENHG